MCNHIKGRIRYDCKCGFEDVISAFRRYRTRIILVGSATELSRSNRVLSINQRHFIFIVRAIDMDMSFLQDKAWQQGVPNSKKIACGRIVNDNISNQNSFAKVTLPCTSIQGESLREAFTSYKLVCPTPPIKLNRLPLLSLYFLKVSNTEEANSTILLFREGSLGRGSIRQ
jgi:hypothetical protein